MPTNLKDNAPEQDIEDLFPWYKSTGGPGLSMTITNIALTFVPMANLVLAATGISVLPSSINLVVTIGVFSFFAVRAAVGYVRAKRTLGARLLRMRDQLYSVKRRLESVESTQAASTKRGD